MNANPQESVDVMEKILAMNEALVDAIAIDRADRKKTKRFAVICAALCFVFMMISICVLGVLASGITIETTTEETVTTQTGEGDSVQFNNVSGDQTIQEG